MIQAQSIHVYANKTEKMKITDIYHIIPCIKMYWKSLPSLIALTTTSSITQRKILVFSCVKIYQINDA